MNISDNVSDYVFVLPSIVIFGLIGNTIALVTIVGSQLRTLPANQYLIVLTVSDSIFLSALTITLFKLDFISVIICQTVEYVFMSTSYLSSCTITLLTVDR
jgi:hypothetical protein